MTADFWWGWMILAAVLIIAEIFTAGFFLLCFGIGAAAAGIFAKMGFGIVWQLVVFIIVSGILFAISRKLADRISKKQPPGIGADRFKEQVCLVLEEINNTKNTGRVRLGREEWRAESKTGELIPADAQVIVVDVDGTRLIVTKVEQGE